MPEVAYGIGAMWMRYWKLAQWEFWWERLCIMENC